MKREEHSLANVIAFGSVGLLASGIAAAADGGTVAAVAVGTLVFAIVARALLHVVTRSRVPNSITTALYTDTLVDRLLGTLEARGALDHTAKLLREPRAP